MPEGRGGSAADEGGMPKATKTKISKGKAKR